jgi:hypothetical protein
MRRLEPCWFSAKSYRPIVLTSAEDYCIGVCPLGDEIDLSYRQSNVARLERTVGTSSGRKYSAVATDPHRRSETVARKNNGVAIGVDIKTAICRVSGWVSGIGETEVWRPRAHSGKRSPPEREVVLSSSEGIVTGEPDGVRGARLDLDK